MHDEYYEIESLAISIINGNMVQPDHASVLTQIENEAYSMQHTALEDSRT